ncbi:MAG TPA: monofunctional biosynthetic peptidoglycan transglycosylase [Steroidobacteraceae bacterium]|nr:monofunctional biosynthetic peptidoglycan transglycosylase [Steroidobacteraceae bacterium]
MALLLIGAVLSGAAVVVMRWWPPATSAFMLEMRVDALARGDFTFHLRHAWVDRAHIAPPMQLAVIASEDQKFPFHHGFDLDSIQDALREQEDGIRSRGASTISQQTAKNLFLWGGHSYLRKALEAWFTLLLELCWPKTRILEVYLNSAQFGPDVFGVEAAAQTYFHKHASALTRTEAAQLAAVLPNPLRLHADRPSAYVASRREWILTQMRALGENTYLRNLR